MRIKNIACIASVLLASLSGIKAATPLAAWTFDNLSTGVNSSPLPAAGLGSASALGMLNNYNTTNSLSNPQVQSLSGSSSGGANCWEISGNGTAPNGGDGWSTQAPIGTQGAKFAGGTAGFYRVMATFDVYATPDAEANLQVQYTTEGTIWYNATNITSGGAAVVASNSSTNVNTVVGTYVTLASGWNNHITIDLSGISGVDNNPSFAIRLVNASSGANCLNTSGGVYNNTSGSWSFDNVVIQGISVDTITEWTFDSYGSSNPVFNPLPEINFGNTAFAQSIGFNTTYIFSDGSHGSTNDPDTTSQAGSSTGNSGPICWRVRGQGPGNGWDTQSPIGTQGGEFDVSTVNYTNVVVNFDLYFTSQAEAKMCVLYTTNAWVTSFTANNLSYAANPTFIQTNDPNDILNYSPSTVSGVYFYETAGQNFYNNLLVDFTGVPGVANNPLFGIRVVNAATGSDAVAYNGGSYNNSSGNARFDNVTFGGQFNGLTPPALTFDPNASVDNPFTNSFTDNAAWRASISAVYVNGVVLTNSAYATNTAGQIIFTPSKSALLQVDGIDSLVIYAVGYSTVKVAQPVAAGVFKKLATTIQPLAPSASGGTLTVNPAFTLTDQYGNTTTNPYNNIVVSAAAASPAGWTLGGTLVQPETNGVVTFTNLSASVNGSTAISGATIAVTVTGYTNAANHTTTTNFNLTSFNIGVPAVPFTPGNLAVLQIDTLSNNTTFSLIEVKPSAAGQTTPVNIMPISANGTNALREAPSATTGRLCLSDDGTLLCFAAFLDGSAATPDETLNLNRAAVGVNYTNLVTLGFTYTSVSPGGSQARAACTIDDNTWIAVDKGGLYQGSQANGNINNPNLDALNNVVVKSFGGVPYVETQKTANGSPIPVVYSLQYDPGDGLYDATEPNNLSTDPVASDFYLISTNCGQTYDIMYINDQESSTLGIVRKYSWVNGAGSLGGYGWAVSGSFTNSTGVDGLLVATNGSGGAYIYYTTGAGGAGANTIIRLTDAAGWNQNMNVVSSNLIYTAGKTVSLKGLAFTPQQVAYASELIPPPILTAQAGANVLNSFSITNTPDDAAWRAAITTVTVNGTVLPTAAYSTTTAGVLVFNPSQSALLQTSGAKTIIITAPGYSTNSIVQALVSGPATQLVITTQPTAPLGAGGPLVHQPVVKVEDIFNNVVTNSANITATAAQTTWTLGGSGIVATTAGITTYTNLTAFSTNAVTGATITFTLGGVTKTSSSFNIPAPVVSVLGGVKMATGKFTFGFTNITGLSYSVLATNLVTAPVSTWPVVGTVTESPAGSGSYSFTNSAATNGVQFYILRQP